MQKALEVSDLSVSYGSLQALEGANLEVHPGEIVALIGPNGAGKSTALKAITGMLEVVGGRITSGEIRLFGERINDVRTDTLIARGVGIVPDGRRIFPSLTTHENLQAGAYTLNDKSVVKDAITRVYNTFPELSNRRSQIAGQLSGGEQQMLAISRSLMTNPKILLADEPSHGLSPNYIEIIFERIKDICSTGVCALIVEQNASKALEIADRVYVFGVGRILKTGVARELRSEEDIKRLYLGG